MMDRQTALSKFLPLYNNSNNHHYNNKHPTHPSFTFTFPFHSKPPGSR